MRTRNTRRRTQTRRKQIAHPDDVDPENPVEAFPDLQTCTRTASRRSQARLILKGYSAEVVWNGHAKQAAVCSDLTGHAKPISSCRSMGRVAGVCEAHRHKNSLSDPLKSIPENGFLSRQQSAPGQGYGVFVSAGRRERQCQAQRLGVPQTDPAFGTWPDWADRSWHSVGVAIKSRLYTAQVPSLLHGASHRKRAGSGDVAKKKMVVITVVMW